MKKTFALSMVAMFAIALAFTSCGKYEEGPAFSLRSKKARVAGDWKIKEYVVNGTTTPADEDDANTTITFEKDGKGEYSWPAYSYTENYGGYEFTIDIPAGSSTFEWEFGDKKESLKITSTETHVDPVTGQTETETSVDESDILKLKEKEMWLQDKDGYETHLEKK